MTTPLSGSVTVQEIILGLGDTHVREQGSRAVDVLTDLSLLMDTVRTTHHHGATFSGRVQKGQFVPRLIPYVPFVFQQIPNASHLLLHLVMFVLSVFAKPVGEIC